MNPNLGSCPDVHADVHSGVEGVALHDSDVAVLGDVVGNVDGIALRVSLVDVNHLEAFYTQESINSSTSPSGWSEARSMSSKFGGRAKMLLKRRKVKTKQGPIMIWCYKGCSWGWFVGQDLLGLRPAGDDGPAAPRSATDTDRLSAISTPAAQTPFLDDQHPRESMESNMFQIHTACI